MTFCGPSYIVKKGQISCEWFVKKRFPFQISKLKNGATALRPLRKHPSLRWFYELSAVFQVHADSSVHHMYNGHFLVTLMDTLKGCSPPLHPPALKYFPAAVVPPSTVSGDSLQSRYLRDSQWLHFSKVNKQLSHSPMTRPTMNRWVVQTQLWANPVVSGTPLEDSVTQYFLPWALT